MQSLRTFLTVLILSVFYPSLLAEDVMEGWIINKDPFSLLNTAGTLKPQGNGIFVGTVTVTAESSFIIKYGETLYRPNGEKSTWDVGPAGETYTFLNNSNYGHIWMRYSGIYTVKATLSDDNSTLSVEFLQPTPLYMSLDGNDKRIADNALGINGELKYPSIIPVSSSPKIINGFKVGDTMYGATSAVQFGDELTAQTRSTNLTTGGQAITLDKRGNYSITVGMTNGVPTQVTIRCLI